ncbi:DUF1338 domain-containing protein [Oceanospirillum sanctuarii]|uniref:DUF1338 domain-containing protein n=1 Tax=Oceanospirillum sanctuarii TaxID=1434821 RepID=UPI000A3C8B11|nr:DUF1338 domain-containing protein [Oceanospirillum sanctuarii]
MNPVQFFDNLWQDYISITPQAEVIRKVFAAPEESANGEVINDHVAFRTFAHTPLQLDNLEPLVLAMGYSLQDEYNFTAKKLRARSYIHPDTSVPKIFISELLTEQLSEAAQKILAKYTAEITDKPADQSVFWSACHWSAPSFEDYKTLMQETEYGAWLLAIGIRVNHFTVSINHLNGVEGQEATTQIQRVLDRVKESGYAVNTVGGEVKGTPEALLEQGSTMADRQQIEFAGGERHEIPTCFYEFALRYPNAEGEVYQGFIEANADKIFESTNAA